MSFVERFIIQCPYFGGSTIGGSTVVYFILLLTTTHSLYIVMLATTIIVEDYPDDRVSLISNRLSSLDFINWLEGRMIYGSMVPLK